MQKQIIVTFASLFIFAAYCQVLYDVTNNTSDNQLHDKSEVFSRRKRFIVFPEGSSVQLVFCNTFPLIQAIGDIVFFGYTAALAYELPKDPYSPFGDNKDNNDTQTRRMDTNTIYYVDEDGRIIYKRNYKKKFIVNPAFAKRSVDETSSAETGEFKKGTPEKFETDRKQMHASKHKREFLKSEHMDERSVEFHRRSRSLLYRKIETMLQGLGENGRHCVLKTLCLVGQTQDHPQGYFFQEILRTVFTLPKGKSSDHHEEEYDAAHWQKKSCDDLYPECSNPVSDPSTSRLSY